MTRITLALLSALAIGGMSLPSHATDRQDGSTAAGISGHASEGAPGAATNPTFGGGWAGAATGEAGGGFDARYAMPISSGGQPVTVTGEAGGSFSRDLAVASAAHQQG